VTPEDNQTLEVALSRRLLTRKQADMIREELEMFPGETASHLMLRRHYVTEEQLAELTGGAAAAASGTAPSPTAAPPPQPSPVAPAPTSPGVAPPAPGGPPRQLSIADLKAGIAPPPNKRNAAAIAGTDPDAPPLAAALQQQVRAGGVALQPPTPAQQPAPAPAQVAQRPAPQGGNPNMPKTLVGFLQLARHWGASDLHLSVGRPPFVRIGGSIRYMEMDALTPERARELNFSALTQDQAADAEEHQQLDFALEIPNVGRHRCNIFRQRLGWDGAYRVVRATVPTLEELGLPPHLRMFTEYHQGLVMITGSGGSGKTTTAAALLDIINNERKDHIITVEDPVEYVIPPKKCQITQREVGRHTQSFGNALRAALREDPDIILVGEMRDLETTAISISAAETGHLVISTMHTSSSARTVARIVDFYPISQQSQVLTMVAESLRGVIAQALIPRKDGRGAALALEVLVNTSGVAQQIKEGKTHMIQSLIQGGKKYGMMLMDDSIMLLLQNGIISGRDAHRRANDKNKFDQYKDQA
jgi:twitching motility protein PilT